MTRRRARSAIAPTIPSPALERNARQMQAAPVKQLAESGAVKGLQDLAVFLLMTDN